MSRLPGSGFLARTWGVPLTPGISLESARHCCVFGLQVFLNVISTYICICICMCMCICGI